MSLKEKLTPLFGVECYVQLNAVGVQVVGCLAQGGVCAQSMHVRVSGCQVHYY